MREVELYDKYSRKIEKIFIKVRKAFVSSLNHLGERNISWNANTLEIMVRKKLSEDIKKRFFEEVIKSEMNWVLNRLEEERRSTHEST